MNFLNNEQGENFKINLYDHGCGLAVGDFDGEAGKTSTSATSSGPTPCTATTATAPSPTWPTRPAWPWATACAWPLPLSITSITAGKACTSPARAAAMSCSATWATASSEDVTKAAGLSHVGHSQTAVFFNYNNDGYLDLFLTNTAEWTTDQFDKTAEPLVGPARLAKFFLSRKEHNRLFHNNRDRHPSRMLPETPQAGSRGRAGPAMPWPSTTMATATWICS